MSKIRNSGASETLTIQRISASGDGEATYENKPIRIPYTVPGDLIEAKIHPKKGAVRFATLQKIISASENRQEPICKHFTLCGGCNLQHLDEKNYREFKQQRLVKSLLRAGFSAEEINLSIKPLYAVNTKSRRRLSWHIAASHKKIKIGFFSERSHEVIETDECQITNHSISALYKPFRDLISEIKPQNAFSKLDIQDSENGMDLLLHCNKEAEISFSTLEILSAFANQNDIARINILQNNRIIPVIKRKNVSIKFGDINIDLPVGAFLQAASETNLHINKIIAEQSKNCRNIIDLFSGIGAHSLPLLAQAKLQLFEGSKNMVDALQNSINANQLADKIKASNRDLSRNPLEIAELATADLVIINPPRNGAAEQMPNLASSGVKNIIMIACHPDSFARDIKFCKMAGYKLDYAQAIDQFTYTPHLEIIAVLRK